MIRVGIFIDTYFPMIDGVIHVVHNYARRMNDGEFEVIVFCPCTAKNYKDEFSYRVMRCKSVKLFFLDYSVPLPKLDRKFQKAIENSKLDIVHIHSPFGVSKMGIKYAKKHNIPAVAFMHSQYRQDFYQKTHSNFISNLLLKSAMKVFNACDEFYAVNPRVAEIFYEYGAKHMPLVQRNCADMFPTEDRAKACTLANDTFGLLPELTVFLFVGRINALKNIYFIVEALKKLHDKNFKMIFVGDGQDMENLRKKVKQKGLVDRVLFTGMISDAELLRALYVRAKLFLFPSMYDSNSLVQLEAASQSTPTVFIKGSATSSAVTDNINGFISDPTPEAFAAKIEEVLADDELYAKVSEGAFRDLYASWDDTVREMKEKYRAIIEKRRNK